MKNIRLIGLPPYSLSALALVLATPLTWAAQVSPLGHTGAINTPTAEVVPTGATAFAVSNSVPEWRQAHTTHGAFGGITGGFGPVPGLELFGRLVYDGDLQCSFFDPACAGRGRDLSLNAKYQLPLKLPLNTKLAVGVTDFGGAATNFRQTYAVATSQLGPLDISLGKSSGTSATALMHGVFGSAELHLTPHWAVTVEDDTRTQRLGAHYTAPVTKHLDLQVGVSKRLSGTADQKSGQLVATLRYVPDGAKPNRSSATQKLWATHKNGETTPSMSAAHADLTEEARARKLAELLDAAGFTHVSISVHSATGGFPKRWLITAEPTGWRQNALDAVRTVLPHWESITNQDTDELLLTLTYLQQPKLSAAISRSCVDGLNNGQLLCAGRQPLQFYWGSQVPNDWHIPAAQDAHITAKGNQVSTFKPQVEMGVDIRSTVGTEYGLADYSLALDVGAEVALGKGWSLQGNGVVPLTASEDFKEGGVFYAQSHKRAEFRQGLLSYWRNLNTSWPGNVALQASAGAINSSSLGGQLDSVWQNPSGDWRVGATLGAYKQRLNSTQTTNRVTALLSARHTLIPGYWQIEGVAGQFLRGDVGFRINSHHWLGAQRLTLFFRSSGGQTATMPKTNFAGFELSFPFGGSQASDLGWATVRGRDRFGWGLSTKVGDTNNNLTAGYGEIARPRHGVWTDVLDHERAGAADARKNMTSNQ
jgi:hypothetical protein